MQTLLVINEEFAIVQCGKNAYVDTVENFILDGGIKLPDGVISIDYNKTNESCWINGDAFQEFPNEYAELVLLKAETLCENFEKRKKECEENERNAEEEKRKQEESDHLANMALDEHKARKLSELNAAHEAAEADAHLLSSLGFEIDANDRANRDVEGILRTIGDGTTMFCDYNNEFHELNRAQVETLQVEIIQNAQSLYAQKWQYRTQVEAAESVEELGAIEFAFSHMRF